MKKTKRAFGYVKFSLIGAECEKFISEAIARGIKIYDVENEDGVLYAKTFPDNYILLAGLKRKYCVQMRIAEKRGLLFRAYRYRNRYGLLLGAIAYCITVFLCSNIIWDITVTGNSDISDESILRFLSDNGIYAGAPRKGLQNTLTELRAMLNYDRLSWISIETEGSRVNVKLSETIDNLGKGLSAGTPCNVTASRGGIIKEVEVNKGVLLYEKGSGVAEGDIIVSGIVNDGAGHITVNHADAVVIAEFEETASFYREFVTVEKVKTDDIIREEYIKLFGFTFPRRSAEYLDGYAYTADSYRVELLGLVMPWSRIVVEGVGTEEVEVTRTVSDVKKQLERELENYERNFLKEYTVIDRKIEYKRDEKGMEITCKYTLQGDIAVQSEIFYRDKE
ncbi:MAG: sporulation protein YqfD [Bacteroides sp.]|nr:sporulation protein YqfD [Bacteroides sp.]